MTDLPAVATGVTSEREPLHRRLMHALGPYLGVIVVLVVLCAYLAATEPTFRTYSNLMNILATSSVGLIIGVGLTLVLLCGGFDISVGGMLGLSGVVMAVLINDHGLPPGVAIIVAIVGATLVGLLINGALIAKLGLQFFVVTIGTMSIFSGLALVLTGGESQSLYEVNAIVKIGNGTVAGIPYPVIIAAVVVVVFFIVTRYLGYGRMIYAVGGNEDAARLAGINVVWVRLSTYGISAGLAAVAGVVMAGRLASAEPTAGAGVELAASAAVLLGGTSFAGGIGGVFGTVLGTLFLGVVANGLTIQGVSSFYQGIVTGIVLIAAVILDRVRRARHAGVPVSALPREL